MFKNFADIDNGLLLAMYGGKSMFLDGLVITLTSGLTWIPLYIALFYLVIKNNERWKYVWLIVLSAGLCVQLSGGLSDMLVKDIFARPRPIFEPSLQGVVEPIRGYTAKGYSFFSSHAANTMAVAVFFCMLVRSRMLSVTLLLWSLTNAWTRIYLGVHYPTDVFTGLLWGAFIGLLVYLFFWRIYRRISPKLHYVSSQYTKTGYALTDIDIVLNVLMLTLAYSVIRAVLESYC